MHFISPSSSFHIILCRPSHPGNIGGVARAMKNMGLHQLTIVQPLCDVNSESYARASGAGSVLDQARILPSLSDALSDCVSSYAFTARRREKIAHVYPLRDAVAEAYKLAPQGNIAFVFGNETNGLNIEELSLCQSMVYIPANPEYASLNLAAAVQLLTYEIYVSQSIVETLDYQPPESPLAQHQQVSALLNSLEQLMTSSGYLDPKQPKQLMRRLQRFIHRSRVEQDEVHLLMGIVETARRKLAKTD